MEAELDLIDEIGFEDLLDQEDSPIPELSNFKNKSKTFPPIELNKNVHLFVKMVTEEILRLSTVKTSPKNLTRNKLKLYKN